MPQNLSSIWKALDKGGAANVKNISVIFVHASQATFWRKRLARTGVNDVSQKGAHIADTLKLVTLRQRRSTKQSYSQCIRTHWRI